MSGVTVVTRVPDPTLIADLERLLVDARDGRCRSMVACIGYATSYRTVISGGSGSVAEEIGMLQMAIWDRLHPVDK